MSKLEPLNLAYDENSVKITIAKALDEFYHALISKLDNIDITHILKKKNPYLYKAKGITNATQIITGILSAYISSSEETIFGNLFF